MVKVFISSVIRGFEEERQAASDAIETLGLRPIMAERFGAQSFSAQEACLEAVRSSDVFLGIIGQRYGHITQAGVSVSEEEFNEAREQGKQVYFFVKNCDRDKQQQLFLDRVQSYEEGYFLAFFDTLGQLSAEIARALHVYGGETTRGRTGLAEASEIIGEYAGNIGLSGARNTACGAALMPVRKSEYISLVELGAREQQDTLLEPALFGSSRILEPALGTQRMEREHSFAFRQADSHDSPAAHLEFYSDGSLLFVEAVPTVTGIDAHVVRRCIIQQDWFNNRLSKFFRYAQDYYANLTNSALVSQVYLQCIFCNMASKWFGSIPRPEPSGISMPPSNIGNPFLVPGQPMQVPRSRLAQAEGLADDVISEVARRFRLLGRYYPAEGS